MPKLFLALGLLILAIGGLSRPVYAQQEGAAVRPIIIAHRGASADRPEHTLMAYRLAIAQGADYIEPDLVITKDGVLVARHENEISETTDVADHPDFAARRTTKMIDGQSVTGWFTEDFTLAELKRLKARERLPQLRPANMAYNDQESIPTLDEIVTMVKAEEARAGRRIGIYPETKHPGYFRALGLPLEEPLLKLLATHGYSRASDPVFIQSFEVGNLMALRSQTGLRLIQLVMPLGHPADRPDLPYSAMLTDAGLAAIARYADGIGAEKSLVIPRDAKGNLAAPTDLVARAGKAGLAVHLWTFRPENYFLPESMRKPGSPIIRGDAEAEIRAYIATGISGYFTDSVSSAPR